MRAFFSVSDKTGIIDLARGLSELGWELISTGGTQKALEEAGLSVMNVSEVTGFPECLDGRVKTLHPNVHAGILAMRDNKAHMERLKELNITPIDLVCVNLYPFKQTIAKPNCAFEDAIENIDIGGPSMLRAAAKNYKDVLALVDPEDYAEALEAIKSGVPEALRLKLLAKVFEHTAAYDALIASYLSPKAKRPEFPDKLTLTFEKAQDMRYGENPHQSAAFYREIGAHPGTLAEAEQLQGKELSFNNIHDANGALDLLAELDGPVACVAVKHANPCGVALGSSAFEAYSRAHDADPTSIYGGIVAINAEVDAACAEAMAKTFLEIIIAPSFTDEAMKVFSAKKNLRLLRLPSLKDRYSGGFDAKKVAGGLLVQSRDMILFDGEPKVVTKRAPTEKEMADMRFAFAIVKHVKSNGIAVAKDGCSLGIGPGQVNRVWAVEHSLTRSGEKVKGAALASDAYFPFDDSVRAAAAAGITCIVQPGGSIRDEDSIKACDELGLTMVFTGIRHFKH